MRFSVAVSMALLQAVSSAAANTITDAAKNLAPQAVLQMAPNADGTAPVLAAQTSIVCKCLANMSKPTVSTCDQCKSSCGGSNYECSTATTTSTTSSSSSSNTSVRDLEFYDGFTCSGVRLLAFNWVDPSISDTGCASAGSPGYGSFSRDSANVVRMKLFCDTGCNSCKADVTVAPGECKPATVNGETLSLKNNLPAVTGRSNGAGCTQAPILTATAFAFVGAVGGAVGYN